MYVLSVFFGGMCYVFYLHYFSIGALYQPSLSTFTVLGQGPHYIARLENDRRSVLKHLLKNQLIGEVGNQIYCM